MLHPTSRHRKRQIEHAREDARFSFLTVVSAFDGIKSTPQVQLVGTEKLFQAAAKIRKSPFLQLADIRNGERQECRVIHYPSSNSRAGARKRSRRAALHKGQSR